MSKVVRFSSFLFVLIFAALLLSGCAKKGAKPGEAGAGDPLSEENLALQNQQRWAGGGAIPNAQEGGVFPDILFGFDSFTVTPDYLEKLREVAQKLQADTTLHAEIEGHCDKRGTSEYNMALGEKRARAVAQALSTFGVQAAQLSTVSYGEEIPLDPADNEDAYTKNRRAHFAVYRKGAE